MVILKSQAQAEDLLLSVRHLGSLWGQVQGLCCTAEVTRPAFTPVFAKLLADAVKTPSLVFPPTSPLLVQRPHYERGSFLCQSPTGPAPHPQYAPMEDMVTVGKVSPQGSCKISLRDKASPGMWPFSSQEQFQVMSTLQAESSFSGEKFSRYERIDVPRG